MAKPTSLLIIVLTLLILVLGLIYLFSSNKETSQDLQPEPVKTFVKPSTAPPLMATPTTQPSTATPKAIEPLTKQQLINLMPIQTNGFNIEYYSNADMFLVTIKESPYDQNRLKSEQWFKDRGITKFEPLNIKWSSFRNVQ